MCPLIDRGQQPMKMHTEVTLLYKGSLCTNNYLIQALYCFVSPQDEYDGILIERDHLRNDLDDLGKHFIVIEKEYLEILEARRLAEEAEEERKRQLELKTVAVIRLQACWRGFRVRKQLKKKDKKGKKGKKK